MRAKKLGGQSGKVGLVMIAGFSLLLAALAGCEDSEPELVDVRASVEPTVEPTVAPRPVVPTKTPLPEQMPTVKSVPTATEVPTPTSTPTEVPTPTATATFTPEEMAFERLSEFVPWAIEPPDRVHAGIWSLLVELWTFDFDFAEDLARLDWVADGVSREESETIGLLAGLAFEDLRLASTVLGLPGVSSGADADFLGAVHVIDGLWGTNADLTREVLGLRWVVDGLDGVELGMLSAVTDVAVRETGLGGVIFEISWLTDDVSIGELETFLSIVEVALRDREVARVMWELSWVRDGVDPESSEAMAFAALMSAFEIDTELLWDLLHFGWIDDGINQFEGEAIREVVATIRVLGSANVEIWGEYLEFAWASRMGSREDLLGFEQINRLIALDQIVGLQAARLTWVGGTLYDAESRLLAKVEEIVVGLPLFASLVLDLPWVVDGVEVGEVATVTRLLAVWEANPGMAQAVAMWPWLTDGLDSDELLVVEEFGEFYGELVVQSPVLANEYVGVVGMISVDPPLEVSAVMNALGRIARLDEEVGMAVMRFEWLTDRVSEGELGLVVFMAELAETVALAAGDAELPRRFVQLPWVVEGSIDVEPEVMLALMPLAEVDAELGDRVATWTWARDDDPNYAPRQFWYLAELLGELAVLDIDLAFQIVDLPWLNDQVDIYEDHVSEVLTHSVIQFASIDRDLAVSMVSHVAGLSFEIKSDAVALESWVGIVLADPGTWGIVRESDWLTDGITEAEAWALSEVFWAAEELPALGGFALGLHWVSDGISDHEVSVITALLELGAQDLVLADQVSGFPWVADGIEDEKLEPEAFNAFARISSVDVGQARAVAGFDWVTDELDEVEVAGLQGITDSLEVLGPAGDRNVERYLAFASNFESESSDFENAFFELGELIASDVASAETVFNTQFFDDDELNDAEYSGLVEVIRYTSSDPAFGLLISELDWVLDGVDFWERDALFHVSRFYEIDPELGSKAVEIDWIVSANDEDPGGQLKSMTQLLEIALIDADFASEMMDWDWLRDDLVYAEPNLLGMVYEIVDRDPRIAKQLPLVVADDFERVDEDTVFIVNQILVMTSNDAELTHSLLEQAKNWSPTITRLATQSVHQMMAYRPDDLERLTRQRWYADGISEDEAVFIGALGPGVRSGGRDGTEDTFFEDMLRSHHVQKRRVDFELAGDATVWVVKHRPFERGENLAVDIGTFAKEVETFFDQPFPTQDLIVVIAEGNSSGKSANFGDHVFFNASWPGSNIPTDLAKQKLAEYYLRDTIGALWLADSVAEFLRIYPDERTFGRSDRFDRQARIDHARSACFIRYGIEDIQGAIDFSETAETNVDRCAETIGVLFLYNLFELMGWDAAGRTLGEIYEKSTSIVGELYPLHSVSEESSYEIFMTNAPKGSAEEVRELYERLHGGRFLYPAEAVVEFDDLPEEVRGQLLLSTKWRDRPDYDVFSEKYLLALGALSEIWALDEELAYSVAQSVWFQEGVNHLMKEALKSLAEIAVADLRLAGYLVDIPALDYRRAIGVYRTFDAVQRLTEADMKLAWEVAESQWVTEYRGSVETLFVQALADFGAADVDSARAVMRTRWITDGLEWREQQVIWNLRYAVRKEPRLLENLVNYDRLMIGARSTGQPDTNGLALFDIAKVAEIDGDLAVELSKAQWIQDDLDQEERRAIRELRELALLDLRRAKEVVRSGWFQRRMTRDEIGRLFDILDALETR